MSLNDRVQRLKSVGLLNLLEDDALNLIAFNCAEQEMRSGSLIFLEGENAEGALFLIEGEISLSRLESGVEIEERRAKAGSLIDEYALISPSRRSQTAKAATEIRYILLDREIFRRVLTEFPGIAERIKEAMEEKFVETVSELNGVAKRLDRLDREFGS